MVDDEEPGNNIAGQTQNRGVEDELRHRMMQQFEPPMGLLLFSRVMTKLKKIHDSKAQFDFLNFIDRMLDMKMHPFAIDEQIDRQDFRSRPMVFRMRYVSLKHKVFMAATLGLLVLIIDKIWF